jgi:hypothetical protein
MKDRLNSFLSGWRDGRNGWVNKKRRNPAYQDGVKLGEYQYHQFLTGPSNPPCGYVYPESPKVLWKPLLAILAADSEEALDAEQLESLTDAELSSSPVANWPFGRGFILQLAEVRGPDTEILHISLC